MDDARKAGTALPAVDELGNDINPHIPQYIAQAPWYLNYKKPTLQHQRNLLEKRRNFDALDTWYPRGRDATSKKAAPTKWKHGSCTNCGASTHTEKNCLELPRKVGAKWSGKHLRGDDVKKTLNLSWEAKRDRWNGYNPDEYRHVVKRYEKINQEREKASAELGDEEKVKEEGGAVVTSGGGRNLRIREDTAKYLYNLDENSAYYDPKTRSMRADPTPHINPEDKDFAGDNFERYTGEVAEIAKQQLHALEASEAGRDLAHMQAEPSRFEATYREFERKKKSLNEQRQKQILDKYGGKQFFEKPKPLVEAEKIARERKAKGLPDATCEVVLEGNHTKPWGSFFSDGKPGYACCHQTTRGAFCTGEDGKQAIKKTEENMKRLMKEAEVKEKILVEEHQLAVQNRKRKLEEEEEEDENAIVEQTKKIRADPMAKFLDNDA